MSECWERIRARAACFRAFNFWKVTYALAARFGSCPSGYSFGSSGGSLGSDVSSFSRLYSSYEAGGCSDSFVSAVELCSSLSISASDTSVLLSPISNFWLDILTEL